MINAGWPGECCSKTLEHRGSVHFIQDAQILFLNTRSPVYKRLPLLHSVWVEIPMAQAQHYHRDSKFPPFDPMAAGIVNYSPYTIEMDLPRCAQRRAHAVRWQLEGHYLTFTFCRKNVGTSRSCPSIIVGSLFSKRPRDTGSNCNVSCFASGFLVAAACVFGSDLKSARGGAGFCDSFSPRGRFSSCFGASG